MLAIRSERESLFSSRACVQPAAAGCGAADAALQLAVIYVPVLNNLLKTQPLTGSELAFCVLLPATVFGAVEIEKLLARRGVLYRRRAPGGAAAAS